MNIPFPRSVHCEQLRSGSGEFFDQEESIGIYKRKPNPKLRSGEPRRVSLRLILRGGLFAVSRVNVGGCLRIDLSLRFGCGKMLASGFQKYATDKLTCCGPEVTYQAGNDDDKRHEVQPVRLIVL